MVSSVRIFRVCHSHQVGGWVGSESHSEDRDDEVDD